MIHRAGDSLTLAQGRGRTAAVFPRRRKNHLQIVEEGFPSFVIQMNHNLSQAALDRSGKFPQPPPLVLAVRGQDGRDPDRLAGPDPDRAEEALFSLVVQSKRNDLKVARPPGDGLECNARSAGADHLDFEGVVGPPLGKNTEGIALAEIVGGCGERIEIPPQLPRIIGAPEGGPHADSAHGRSEDRNLKERRFCQEFDRPPGREADHDRIDERIGVVRHQQHRAGRRNAVAVRDFHSRIVKAHERAHELAESGAGNGSEGRHHGFRGCYVLVSRGSPENEASGFRVNPVTAPSLEAYPGDPAPPGAERSLRRERGPGGIGGSRLRFSC